MWPFTAQHLEMFLSAALALFALYHLWSHMKRHIE